MGYKDSINFRLLDPTGITEGLAVAGTVAAVASAAAGTAAAVNQAQEQQKAATYNAQVQSNNAQVAAWQRQQQQQEYAAQALVTQQEGAQAASRLEMQNGALVARNIAAAASSGLQITGSTQDVISGSAANNELAVLIEEHDTQIKGWENQIGAANATYNDTIQQNRYAAAAGLDTAEAGFAQESGMFSGAGSGAAGAARIGTALNAANNSGLFD